MNGQIQYADGRALTAVPTPEAGSEAARRIGTLRHELRSIGRRPARAELQRLLDRARELSLREEDIQEELHEIRVSLEALDFADRIAREGLPAVASLDRLPAGERCHFITPVRFGRRRSDQIGHLELTSGCLRFHGALDLSVVWTEVAAIERDGRNICVSLVDSRRVLRFCCHSPEEASRGAVIARHLAFVMTSEAPDPGYQPAP